MFPRMLCSRDAFWGIPTAKEQEEQVAMKGGDDWGGGGGGDGRGGAGMEMPGRLCDDDVDEMLDWIANFPERFVTDAEEVGRCC